MTISRSTCWARRRWTPTCSAERERQIRRSRNLAHGGPDPEDCLKIVAVFAPRFGPAPCVSWREDEPGGQTLCASGRRTRPVVDVAGTGPEVVSGRGVTNLDGVVDLMFRATMAEAAACVRRGIHAARRCSRRATARRTSSPRSTRAPTTTVVFVGCCSRGWAPAGGSAAQGGRFASPSLLDRLRR